MCCVLFLQIMCSQQRSQQIIVSNNGNDNICYYLCLVFVQSFITKWFLAPVNFGFQGCNYSALPRLRESLSYMKLGKLDMRCIVIVELC